MPLDNPYNTTNPYETSFAKELMILQDEIDQLSEQLAHLESLVDLHVQSLQALKNIY